MSGKLRLPPLNALRVFHAVTRHRSLRAAADELLVTPQAVGQQIRLLEQTLGVMLVEREGRRIRLSEQALTLSHYLNAGFEEFAEGVRRVTMQAARNRINLNVSPFFATRYLMPRLHPLRRALPGLELSLTTMIDLSDLSRAEIDLSVLWGFGETSEYQSTFLVRDPKVICCTPNMAHAIRAPQDLLKFMLLHPVKGPRMWFNILCYLGVTEPATEIAVTFDDAATMRRATLQGLGIGLISQIDAEEDIRQGTLVAPLGVDALADMPLDMVPGFYLVAPRTNLRAPHVSALHKWIIEQDWANPPEIDPDLLDTMLA